MRIGGSVLLPFSTPKQWLEHVKNLHYRAVILPVDYTADVKLIDEYVNICKENDLFIAEVGAWSNPISVDEEQRRKALNQCKKQLELAEYVKAACCVNIAGSRNQKWDGPDASHYTDEIYNMIIDSVREIIDAVNPQNTCYSLETMPWIAPDTVESYLDLIKDIDRPGFGVHLDPCNIITSPTLYYKNAEFLTHCFDKLGPYIKSVHAKDLSLADNFLVHLSEVEIGTGNIDYDVWLTLMSKCHTDMPLIIEHLNHHEQYVSAVSYVENKLSILGLS